MSRSFRSSHPLLAICAALAIFAALASSTAFAAELEWASLSAAVGRTAGKLVGEEEEFGLDSETNRRILATSRYISYGAMQRNTVPCSRRGASYYNCKPGAQSNPYSRGCSSISRCRS
ncbi:rapid alkalinization factor-like [Punica granatum]|uniref:Rapid alkalinization factor-like n=2 Tax=Punica granatum TaxID=22663 RepID=A0A6P8E9D3_PUNGR|nr:rapid alkalinization factor-like [Punica granatum]PKI51505.1 hypothetical protein CRG98_028065 [Punica granatum]